MAGYKEIKGFHVQTRSSDPGPTEAQVGDFYYNSSTGQFKNIGAGVGSWASGGDLNNRRFGPAGGGVSSSQTAAIAFGGDQMPTEPRMVGYTETYNGSSWTEVNDLNSDRGQLGGAGTTTAALAFGGEGEPPGFADQAITESWNGSSWTEVNDLNTARKAMAAFGTQTAALAAGGNPGNTTNTETWNGSSWTEVNNLNNGASRKGTGTTTGGLAFGGGPPTPTYPKAEEWDGTSWTEVTDMSTARSNAGGFGTYRDAIVCGGTQPGSPGFTVNTENWDGTSWTELNNIATARNNMSPAGTNAAGLIAGGYSPPGSPNYGNVVTEEWTTTDFTIKTVTTS